MSAETSSSLPESPDGGQNLFSGSNMPPLPPGYHFIISFCDVACTREQMDAMHADLVEVARTLIREYELRTASGRFANTRVHINRTAPLIDEDLSNQNHEARTENLQDVPEEDLVNDRKLIASGSGADAAAGQ